MIACNANGQIFTLGSEYDIDALGVDNYIIDYINDITPSSLKFKQVYANIVDLDDISQGNVPCLFSIAITEDNKCYGWGNNKYNQLKNDDSVEFIDRPTLFDISNTNNFNDNVISNIALGYKHIVINLSLIHI